VPAGQWFTLEVIADGDRIVVMVDDRVTMQRFDDGRLFSQGHIALEQADPEAKVEFSSIEIKELKRGSDVGGLATTATGNTTQALAAHKPVSVLIITGDNVAVHDWKGTTEVFKQILNDPARFKVDLTETPAKDLTDVNLARYEVLLLNYKDTPKGGADTNWSEANKAAFLRAVKVGGKGLYVHHFSSGAFTKPINWTEFENAIAGGFRSQGFHGPPHVFTVKKSDAKTPISEGLPVAFVHAKDELYSNSLMTPGSVVIATAYSDPANPKGTGKDEAIIWVNRYGMGRVVNNVLGHDTDAMSDPSYQAWVRRCIEWAGSRGDLSIEAVDNPVESQVKNPSVPPATGRLRARRTGPGRPADARKFLGKYYKVFPQQLTWHEAKVRCQELGGHLVVVSSEQENRFLTSLVKERMLGGAWLGATDEQSEGRWIWVDGTPLRYSNWDIPNKQPNNKQGIEHYMVLLTRLNGTWCDQPNDGRQEHPGFICEWD
jgi:type 1 glutamine amidotransferase